MVVEKEDRKRILKSAISTMKNNQEYIQYLTEEIKLWKNKYIEKDKEVHQYRFNIKNTIEYSNLYDKYIELLKEKNRLNNIEKQYNDMLYFFKENHIKDEIHLKKKNIG